MENKMYRQTEDNRYTPRYEYSNACSKEIEADPNYYDYGTEDAEYPIGDGQNIDQSALPPGDCYVEDVYRNYRHAKEYLQPTRGPKCMTSGAPKYVPSFGLRPPLQNRPSAYFEVGDYKRTIVRNKASYLKNEPSSYGQYIPEYTMSKAKRECVIRNLTQKDYRNRVQKMIREERSRLDRYEDGQSNYYVQEQDEPEEQLTHEELQENFKKNYNMDLRRPPEPTQSKVQALPVPVEIISSGVKKSTTPRSDTLALRERYDNAYRRFYAGEKPSSATKDTKSEPVQPDYKKLEKLLKSPKRRAYKEYIAQRPLTADDYAHEMLKNKNKKSNDLEIKYKNDDYGKITQDDTDVGLQERQPSFTMHGNQQSSLTSLSHMKSSDEKVSQARKNISKIRTSVRSSRSKKSINTGRSKKYEDLINLQKSKCTIMSVIYDGLQKCEQAKYEMKGENCLHRPCKQSQTIQNAKSQCETPSIEMMHTIISNMFKEFRDYHLQNISQEVKRIQYLDVLPEKLSHLQGPQ